MYQADPSRPPPRDSVCLWCWLRLGLIRFLHPFSICCRVASQLLPRLRSDRLACLQPDADRQQPALGGRTRAEDVHLQEAQQGSPAGWNGQHRHCRAQVLSFFIIILRIGCTAIQKKNTLDLNFLCPMPQIHPGGCTCALHLYQLPRESFSHQVISLSQVGLT